MKLPETDKRRKNDIFWYFLEIAPMVLCFPKYCIISFRYVSFIPTQPVFAIKFWYDNYQYRFCNFKNRYDKNRYRYRAFLWSHPGLYNICLILYCSLNLIHFHIEQEKSCWNGMRFNSTQFFSVHLIKW